MWVIFYIDDISLDGRDPSKSGSSPNILVTGSGLPDQWQENDHGSLSVTVNTQQMELSLPPEKMKKIWAEAWKLLMGEGLVSARALVNATNQVIFPALVFYCGI